MLLQPDWGDIFSQTYLSLCLRRHCWLLWATLLRCRLGFWILEPTLVPVTHRLLRCSFPSASTGHSRPQMSAPSVQENKWRLNTSGPWRDSREMWDMYVIYKKLCKNAHRFTHSWLTGTNRKSFWKMSTWRVHVFTRWCRRCLWQLRVHREGLMVFTSSDLT